MAAFADLSIKRKEKVEEEKIRTKVYLRGCLKRLTVETGRYAFFTF
ncbi:MAG: hypothetical protein AAF630_13640 [Cyanobacteria bacterium P01_C01_bin.38]